MLAEPLEATETVELGHPHVEQHDVRLRLPHGRNDVAADRDLAHDLEVLRVCERAANRGQHEPMVVRNEYSKSVQPPPPFPRASYRRSARDQYYPFRVILHPPFERCPNRRLTPPVLLETSYCKLVKVG